MYRIGCTFFVVLTILIGVSAQNSDGDKITVTNDFLQQIESQCAKPEQCEFTDEQIEQISQYCKGATQNLNPMAYPNLELCQTFALSDAEIETLLNQYITYLENASDSVQTQRPNQFNPYVMLLKQ